MTAAMFLTFAVLDMDQTSYAQTITISNPAPNTDSFYWTVEGVAESDYIIKIASADGPDVFDESELFLITADYTLFATGSNSSYQRGDGTNINRSTWTACTFSGTVNSICATRYNSYVITDTDELWGVGSNFDGQLGLGHNNPVTEWTKLADNVVQVAGGVSFTVYLATDGTIHTDGNNDYKTLVQSKTGVDFARAGLRHTLIRLTTGALYACWSNTNRQIGLGSDSGGDYAETPEIILSSVTNMGCGASFSVLNCDGSLLAAGSNSNGELGFGYADFTNIYVFQPVGSVNFPDYGKEGAEQIGAGEYHSLIKLLSP